MKKGFRVKIFRGVYLRSALLIALHISNMNITNTGDLAIFHQILRADEVHSYVLMIESLQIFLNNVTCREVKNKHTLWPSNSTPRLKHKTNACTWAQGNSYEDGHSNTVTATQRKPPQSHPQENRQQTVVESPTGRLYRTANRPTMSTYCRWMECQQYVEQCIKTKAGTFQLRKIPKQAKLKALWG